MRKIRTWANSVFKVIVVITLLTLLGISAEHKINYEELFEKHNLSGSILLYDLESREYSGHNLDRADSSFVPASTFKILNSLIALETGVISSVDELIPWDSVDRGWEKWNTDHNLRSAMKYSAVWFYQLLATRIGQERMQLWIDSIEYGNQNISGGIGKFWLEGGLRISQRQHIELLVKLYSNDLPFSDSTCQSVKDILILEESTNFTLRGKTGWASRFDPQIGWFVGYAVYDKKICFFATRFSKEKPSSRFTHNAKTLTRELLVELGYAPSLAR